jgi:hypothetical protein
MREEECDVFVQEEYLKRYHHLLCTRIGFRFFTLGFLSSSWFLFGLNEIIYALFLYLGLSIIRSHIFASH